MAALYSKFISFIMTVLVLLFPWISFDRADADLTVKLAANETTGYSWSCEIEKPEILVMTGSSYKKDFASPGMLGTGGTQYFYFDALTSGQSDITFTYSQQWAGGDTAEIIVYTVSVDADMNVTYEIAE